MKSLYVISYRGIKYLAFCLPDLANAEMLRLDPRTSTGTPRVWILHE